MTLVSLIPADKLLTLEGLYKRYGLDAKAQEAIEERILAKYNYQPPRQKENIIYTADPRAGDGITKGV